MADRIPIFPLHTLLLPTTDLGVHVFEPRFRELVAHSLDNGHAFGVVLEGHQVGTLATIAGYAQLPDGRYLLELEGGKRFETYSVHQNGSYPTALVRFLPEHIGNFAEARQSGEEVARLFHVYRSDSGDGDLPVHLPVDPITRSYVVASLLRVDVERKQRLLEADAADERLALEIDILRDEITLLERLQTTRA